LAGDGELSGASVLTIRISFHSFIPRD
jgi:hypothetical protein